MWKKLYKESGDDKDAIQIDTGLKGDLAKDILDSVIGQMSDGMWENSPAMEHYWRYINVVKTAGNQVFLVVDGITADASHVVNYFNYKMGMDEGKIKEFMGNKLKAVAKQELKDDPDLGSWDRNNTSETGYLSYDRPITFQEVYFVYEILKGRDLTNVLRKYPDEVSDELLA